jgi:beta-phosphoglucomutase-like phosphatase (HAD superfamily)
LQAWNAAMSPLFGRTFSPTEVVANFGVPDGTDAQTRLAADLSLDARDAAIERYFAAYQAAHAGIGAFEGVPELLESLRKTVFRSAS